VVKGKQIETEEIPAYCAVASAGLGNLPDTILSRSVIIRMRKRAPTESVQPFRRREHIRFGGRLLDAAIDVGGLDTPEAVLDRLDQVTYPGLNLRASSTAPRRKAGGK
jgi:hypothetical protein